MARSFFLHCLCPLVQEFTKRQMAERGGFEPPVLFRHSRFPGVRVKPLCHLSNRAILFARLRLNGKPISAISIVISWLPRLGESGRTCHFLPADLSAPVLATAEAPEEDAF